VAALDGDRYAGSLTLRVKTRGEGRELGRMRLSAEGAVTDASLLGARIPRVDFSATMADDQAHVTADGEFSQVDPSVVSGRPAMKGVLAGSLTVDATATELSQGVTLDTVRGSAQIALEPSSVGHVEIRKARLDADYERSIGTIRVLEIAGPDIDLTSSGTVALDDASESNLTIHAASSDLSGIGMIVEQPILGIATLDAVVTGNRHRLKATGTLTGNDLAYQGNSLLTVASAFSLSVPELAPADAEVHATSEATFVDVGGLRANAVAATTTYAHSRLDFDVTAKQPARSVAAAGSVALRPDTQEVRLDRLDLQADQARWQTEAGVPAVIRYGGSAVAVDNLVLVNGSQRLEAAGKIGGATTDALHVTVTDVDLAGLEALALRPPQLTGTLSASGTITGTTTAPLIEGTFRVAQGGVSAVKYDSFGGSVAYNGKGVTVDATLQQNPVASITLRGYAPVSLFSRSSAAATMEAHNAVVPHEDRVDISIDSSPIDLGLVQGVSSAVTNVKGTLEAHVRITGSAADPHPVGVVSVQNGAFSVGQTGVAYTNLRGRIDLQPDGVHIDELSVLDNQQSALSLTGSLATHEGQIGRVQLYVTASDFKVVDNEMGTVRVDSSLQISGELGAPRIEGDLGVSRGNLNLDPILAAIADSPYSTKQTTIASASADAQAAQSASLFGGLRMDLRFTVPNDLIVKASDVRTPNAPIGLGAINLTLGGDLRASKDAGGQVSVVGAVNTVRGFYDFQGRRFDILRDGTLRFDGTDLLQPALDIRAERVIQAVTAHVNVRGTLDKPEILLSSTPPLEQADILALIVFNQPINQLGEGQQATLVQRASALAAGTVAGELGKSLERALNLDEFAISTAPEGGGVAQLTVGQQIAQGLYVKVQQGIGDSGQTNVILEYELAKWLRLQTNVVQGGDTQQQLFQRARGSGVDLLFFVSF
jgi:hypothetical protein